MLKISRRQFLHGVTALTVAAKLHASPDLLSETGRVNANALRVNSKTLSEMEEVLRQWQANESLSPSAYLSARGVSLNNKLSIEAMSRKDFKEGNVIEVKGMVLAKTEAATISMLAEKLTLLA